MDFCLVVHMLSCMWIWTTVTSSNIHNFDEQKEGYEFVFHDQTNLFLMEGDTNCYFIFIAENRKAYVGNVNYRLFVEKQLSKLVNQTEEQGSGNEGTQGVLIKSSSLGEVRDSFADRLADFHCLDKHIHTVSLSDAFFQQIMHLVG